MSMHVEIYREQVPLNHTVVVGPGTYETYDGPTPKGDWRWRFVAGNGKTMADSGEGYKRKPTMLRSVALVLGGEYHPKSTAYTDDAPYYPVDCIERWLASDDGGFEMELLEIRVVDE